MKKYLYKHSAEGPLLLRTVSPEDLIILGVFSPEVAESLTKISLKLIKQRQKNRNKKHKSCGNNLTCGNENCFQTASTNTFDPIVEQLKSKLQEH